MSLQDAYEFDPAAFVAAAQALAQAPLRAVSLPGLPPCFKRPLTAGDVIEAATHREKLQAAGLEPSREVDIAIGMAQTLCGPQRQPIFDASNRQHIEALIGLPWDTVRPVIGAEKAEDEKNG